MQLPILFFISTFFFQTQWQEYTDLEGRFKITTPGHFVERTDSISTGVGGLVYHTFFYQNNDIENSENEVYMVSYCDYPEEIVFTDSIGLSDDFFQTTIDAAVESVNGKLRYATEIQLDNYPGKFWRIRLSGRKRNYQNKSIFGEKPLLCSSGHLI